MLKLITKLPSAVKEVTFCIIIYNLANYQFYSLVNSNVKDNF